MLFFPFQPISEALAYFSTDPEGRRYHPQQLKISDVGEGDNITSGPLNITLDMEERPALTLKLHLFFQEKWILLSEVGFQFKEYLGGDLEENDDLEKEKEEGVVPGVVPGEGSEEQVRSEHVHPVQYNSIY